VARLTRAEQDKLTPDRESAAAVNAASQDSTAAQNYQLRPGSDPQHPHLDGAPNAGSAGVLHAPSSLNVMLSIHVGRRLGVA
jgi:hypothetical protein